MTIHRNRFDGRVEDYVRYRMRFPTLVIEVLRERCGLRAGDVIADVGAGTGMSAELFLADGHKVTAVEPNAQMRAACEQMGESYPKLRVVDATAEETTLEDAAYDFVVVGRAFHWFDQERALAEFRRILRPGGWLVLLTSRRAGDVSDKSRSYEALLLKHGTSYDEVRKSYETFGVLQPWGATERVQVEVAGVQRLTLEHFLGQTQSLSISPLPGSAGYAGMQTALREFFAQHAVGDVMELETVCEVLGWRTPE